MIVISHKLSSITKFSGPFIIKQTNCDDLEGTGHCELIMNK